jgi:putative ABC transport system ATP-binding protein
MSFQPASVAVECRDVSKVFGDGESAVRALDHVGVQVAAGALTLLVGPSGCGKTTLISVIAGLLDPTAGEVTVMGVNQTRLAARDRLEFRKKNIGFVFQQYNLLPALTAEENACVPLLINGMPRPQALAQAADLLGTLGMGNRRHHRPALLSGGQQQRVAIARALIHHPRLLVCDEPTAALDTHSGFATMQLLRKVAVHPDRAVIVVTHDNRIFEFGNHIITMSDGRVEKVEDGPGLGGRRQGSNQGALLHP